MLIVSSPSSSESWVGVRVKVPVTVEALSGEYVNLKFDTAA